MQALVFLVLIILELTALGCSSSRWLDPNSPSTLVFYEGTQKIEQGKFEEGAEILRNALKIRPDFPEAYVNLGAALAALGRIDEAVTAVRESIRLEPKYALSHASLGRLLTIKKEHKEAYEHLQKAVELDRRLPAVHINLAYWYLAKRDWASAKEEASLAARLSPSNDGMYAIMGAINLDHGNIDEALVDLKHAVLLDPNNPEYRKFVGQAYLKKQKWFEADMEFDVAVRLAPRSAETYVRKAEVAKGKDSYDEAMEMLRQAVRVQPEWPSLTQELRSFAGYFQLRGRLDLAVSAYKAAITISPREESNYQLLAEAYKADGNIEAELETWRNVLAVSGGSKVYLKGLLDTLWRYKRTDEALQELDRFIKASPNDPELQLAMASYLWLKGDKEAAAETLRVATHGSAGGGQAMLALGSALWEMHFYDEAIAEFTKAVRLYPEWPEAHAQLASKLGETGDIEKSVEHAKEGLLYGLKYRKGKQLANIYATLGLAYTRVGKGDASVGSLREAIRLDPDSAMMHHNMAYALLRKGSLDSAQKEIQKAVALNSSNAAIRDTYALILDTLNQPEQAQSELREAIRISPAYPPAHYHLAVLLLKIKQFDEGYRELEQFLQSAPVLGRYKEKIEDARNRLARRSDDER